VAQLQQLPSFHLYYETRSESREHGSDYQGGVLRPLPWRGGLPVRRLFAMPFTAEVKNRPAKTGTKELN
jgi:hypothetical protein